MKTGPCQESSQCEIRIALNVRHAAKRLVTVAIASHSISPIYSNKDGNFFNDIAIIKLAKPVYYTTGIRPICLAVDPQMTKVGTTVKVIGFGITEPGGKQVTVLKELSLPIRSLDECRKKLDSNILETAICAGGLKNVDSCEGDSGSPMFFTDAHGRSYQVGIVSWGHGCGQDGLPAVYTRINLFLHWIRQQTADSPSCETLFPPLIGSNIEDCGIIERDCDVENPKCKLEVHRYNWMVRFFYKGKYIGTGVLTGRRYILTTTQVIPPWNKFNASDISMIVGTRDNADDALNPKVTNTESSNDDMMKVTKVSPSDVDMMNNHSRELKCSPSHALYHLLYKQVPVVIIIPNLRTQDLTLLYHPLCMTEPKQKVNRVGEIYTMMFWREKKNRKYSEDVELKIRTVDIVDPKNCTVSSKMKDKIICGVIRGKDKCHERGAVLMDQVGGRFYLIGFVSPSTKKCSKVKKFLDTSWNYNWIHNTLNNIKKELKYSGT